MTTATTGAYVYTNVHTLYTQKVVNYVPPVEVFEFEPEIKLSNQCLFKSRSKSPLIDTTKKPYGDCLKPNDQKLWKGTIFGDQRS